MRTTQQLREVWGPPCSQRYGSFRFWNGTEVYKVEPRCLEAWRALDWIFRAWNYQPREGESWGGNCRRITGGSGYSLHAYWIAGDVNSRSNPYGPRLVTDRPRDMVEAILAVRTHSGQQVWGWGGNYRRNKDAMHDEVVASPDELASGIDWATVRRPGGAGGRNMGRFPNTVGSRPAPGGGHWLVAADGGVAAFGAPFHGSLPGLGVRLNAPVVDLVPTPGGAGYWLIGADGGIFAFGNAPAVEPYAPLGDEWARGERAVAGAHLSDDGRLWLVADTGDPYQFTVPWPR